MKTDLIYPLGTGSKWDDNEIRVSIRSVMKNLTGFNNIYIVGEKPNFLRYDTNIDGHTIYHIPADDPYGKINADGNIISKLLLAAADERTAPNLLLMNDDHYFIKPIHLKDIYPFHKGKIDELSAETFSSAWGKRLGRTRQHLNAAGIIPLHFDHHAPMLFKKDLIAETYAQFDYQSSIGLTIKSIYGSIHYPHAIKMQDEKCMIRKKYELKYIQNRLKNVLYLAHNDEGLSDSLKYYLYSNFKKPTEFETKPIEDKIFNIAEWRDNGKPYETGSVLFVKYIKSKKNLHRIILTTNTYYIRSKISYFFERILNTL